MAFNDSQLDIFEGAIRGSLPVNSYRQDYWHFDGASAYLCLETAAKEATLLIGFRRDRRGRCVLDAGYLAFDKPYQKQGIAKLLARRLLWAADQLKAERIETLANLDIGSYAWALMAARPLEPSKVEMQLQDRANDLVSIAAWTPQQRDLIAPKLNPAANSDFMHDISQTLDGTRKLGFELLSEHLKLGKYSWDAYWDLTDAGHRAQINRALR